MSNPEQDAAAPPLRAWSCSRGWLVWRGLPWHTGVRMLSGRLASVTPLAKPPSNYWLVGYDGEVAAKFESEERRMVPGEVGGVLYAIERGSLFRFIISYRYSGPASIRKDVMIPGLAEVVVFDAEAAQRIAAAIAREEARQEEQWRAAVQAGRERLAAIPGALGRFDAGAAFRGAQTHLRRQVFRFYAPASEAMLRGLVAFGELHRAANSAWRDTLAWAMEPFVAACCVVGNSMYAKRLVKLGELAGDPSPPPPEQREAARQLAESLPGVRAKVLHYRRQMEESDANLTAIRLGKAAELVETAHARMLRVLGDEGRAGG